MMFFDWMLHKSSMFRVYVFMNWLEFYFIFWLIKLTNCSETSHTLWRVLDGTQNSCLSWISDKFLWSRVPAAWASSNINYRRHSPKSKIWDGESNVYATYNAMPSCSEHARDSWTCTAVTWHPPSLYKSSTLLYLLHATNRNGEVKLVDRIPFVPSSYCHCPELWPASWRPDLC